MHRESCRDELFVKSSSLIFFDLIPRDHSRDSILNNVVYAKTFEDALIIIYLGNEKHHAYVLL